MRDESEVQLWVSPYRRTQETARAVALAFSARKEGFTWQFKESLYLAERQFGLVDTHEEFTRTHSAEHAHYRLHVDQGFGFWARPPMGESPFDVCLRLDFFLKMVLPAQGTHVIVSHGMALRAIQMMELALPTSAYDGLPNPNNASVRLLQDGRDCGTLIEVAHVLPADDS